ncbi:MAG: phosphoribosylanthranilate isomerase [Pseudomonadota bacterium]|nr:phosphoribosylanthranilate isomerase [Pseudomonadota bacterium]
MTLAKICGLSTPEAVAAALAGGAAYLGFVFFAASPRDIAPHAAARLAGPARGRAAIVAVTVDPDDALIDRLTSILHPDLIQLHGRESPVRTREIAARAGVGVIKALRVAQAADLAAALDYEAVAEHLMFDAPPPEASARPGGTGAAFDAAILAGRRFARPWFLAGGLDPWNVARAIGQSAAPMVDVSTGVERGPGLKDPAQIEAFLEAVRRA